MKFRCSSNDLLSALQVAIRALSVRSPQPILEGVLIEALDDEVRLTASDGTFTIITTLPAAVEDEGDAVMPGRLFNEVVRKMPSGEVSANLSHSYVLSLRCLGSRTNISGQNADAYPRVEVSANDAHIELPQSLVKDMITRTSFAVPMEDQRQVLTGGFFNMQNGQIDMVGLDGFRMAMRTARVSDTEHTVKAIIPLKSLEEIAKLMADDEESRVEMRFGNNQLFVKLGSTRLITSLIDGEYIDYRRVIPRSFNTELTVGREEFARCVDRASLMAREGKNNRIKFTVEGERRRHRHRLQRQVYDGIDPRSQRRRNDRKIWNACQPLRHRARERRRLYLSGAPGASQCVTKDKTTRLPPSPHHPARAASPLYGSAARAQRNFCAPRSVPPTGAK